MIRDDKGLEFCIKGYYPKDFFNSNVNEEFIKYIMSIYLKRKEWGKGNPNKCQPDYFSDGEAFEFTIASDDKKNSFVRCVKEGNLSMDDISESMMLYIKNIIIKKSQKKYSVNDVSLCILCIFNCTCWVLDKYGSYTSIIDIFKITTFFDSLKKEYISKNIFKNIYIIFPDSCKLWWIADIDKKVRKEVLLLNNNANEKYPYYAYKE